MRERRMKTVNGKRMRKRALSILLACTMLFSCMDLTALAAEPDVKTQVTAPDDGETVAETPEGENDAGDNGGEIKQPETPEQDVGDKQNPGLGTGGEETAGSADEETDKKGEAEPDKPDADEENGSETGRDEKGESVSENSVSENSVSENSISENSLVTVNATNALGRYFAEMVSETVSEKNDNTGCDVYEVTWNGREAAVSFRTTERSTLVLGIYEEDSGKLAASGSVDVSPKDTETVVSIGMDNIPEYFVLRAFLIAPESAKPLGRVYETEDYTRKMQEFYAKTTADFTSEQVLNLDEDTYNNFLVFSQDVKVIRTTENADVNKVIVCDEDNRSYTIQNPDEQITSLKAGDIIAYYYDENALIITKVYSITTGVEGGKQVAVILGEDADFASVIEFIKVGAENPAQNARSAYAAYADSVEVSKEWGIDDWSKDDGDGVSVNLKDIGGESTIRVFLDSREKIEKTELEISYGATASVECKIDGELPRWELGNPTMPTNVPGVTLSCKIEVKLAAEVIGSYTGSLSGSVGVAIEKGGVRNISRTPEFVLSESAEASVSLGLVISPMIQFLHEDILSAALEVDGGVKVTAKRETNIIAIASERHACEKCFAIGIGPYVNLAGKLTFLWDTEDIEILGKDWTVKSCYYSVDHREFGWDECPYKEYKTTVVVKTLSDELVSDAKVNDEAITNKRGIATIWLPGGDHIIYASHNGKSGSKRVIADSAKSVDVILGMYAGLGKDTVTQICLGHFDRSAAVTSDGSLYTWGSNAMGSLGTGGTDDKSIPTKVLDHAKAVLYGSESGARISAAITGKGELYTWGQNNHNALGNGTTDNRYTPGKILDNVKSVCFGFYNGAAVTKDGQLYLWGKNNEGQLGNGTSVNQPTPVRILADETVKEVSLGTDMAYGYSAAVTTDGKLYMWGYNGNGELGSGETNGKREPVRILENEKIKKVCLSQRNGYSAAVTDDGQLYMWGYNYYGQLGNATTTTQTEPVKVLDGIKVKEIEISRGANAGGQSAAIAEDGSLYLWGKNTYGQLGTGDTDNRTVPFRLDRLGKVKAVRLGEDNTAAITEGGELYMWGRNGAGQLGDGTTTDRQEPVKILDDVVSVEVQDTYTAAVTVDGSLWMWGYNINGQLGTGEKSKQPVTRPVRVTFPADTGTDTQSVSEGYAVGGEEALLSSGETYVYDEETLESKEAAYVYVTMRTTSYPENAPTLIVDADQPAKQTANFSGLKPQETYNVYVMKDRDSVQRFSNDNLLYLIQAVSGADGNLSVAYEMREACAQPDVFCVGMSRTDLSTAQISVPDIIYDGEEHVAEAEVICDGRTLIAGSDYELCGDVLVSEIGEYKVIIKGIGTYRGEKEALFRVKEDDGGGPDQPDNPGEEESGNGDVLPEDMPADGKIPEGLWIAGLAGDGYNYTGAAIKPAVRVYDYKTLLEEKRDYTIAYKNHTKAFEVRENASDTALKNAPTITVTGKGNYTGKDTQTFSIHALDIGAGKEENLFETDDLSVVSNKKAQKPVPVLWWNGKKLKNKTDYSYTYHQGAYAGTDTAALDSVKDAGDYYIKIMGKGNFTGELRVKLTLLAATDSAAGDPALRPAGRLTVAKIPGQEYLTQAVDGKVTPKLTVRDGKTTLTEGTHYTVSYSNNAKPGTAYAIVKGVEIGGYSGTKRVSFTIKGVSIKKAAVKGMPKDLIYNGKEQEPALTLTVKMNGVDTTLVRDTDYTLKWTNNSRVGTATVTFTGKNAYSGILKKTVKIKAFDIRENQEGRFQAEMKSSVVPYAKGGAKPALTVTFKKSDQTTETLKEGTDFTVSYKNNKALHDGSNAARTPEVVIKGKGNFTGTYAQKLTYQITQQSLDNLTISAADKVYQNKKNIFATKVKVFDVDGKALSAGRDYDKKLKYAYKNDTRLDNGTVRAAGTEVNKDDIIPAGTVITVTAFALTPTGKTPDYTGSCTGEYSFRTYDIAKAKVTIPAQIYTGKAITLDKTDASQLLVKVNGKKVEPDQFEIVAGSYTNNVKKGTASVTIRGVDNYGGTKKVSFRIKAKGFLWWWRK